MVFRLDVKVNKTVHVPENFNARAELYRLCEIYSFQCKNDCGIIFKDDHYEDIWLEGFATHAEAVLLEYNELYDHHCWALKLHHVNQTTTNILIRPDFRNHLECMTFEDVEFIDGAVPLEDWQYHFHITYFYLQTPWNRDKTMQSVWVPLHDELTRSQCKVSDNWE